MAKIYNNKCIFCFKPLNNTDICFETVDDVVDLQPDPVKLAYEKRFNPNVDEGDMLCLSRMPIMNYSEGNPEFEVDSKTGVPVAWNEPKNGWSIKSHRRLCRFCHQPLPSSFGERPNVTVGLCGNSASGKTVYMLSLVHDLQSVDNMAVTPDPMFFSGMNTDYEGMYAEMYGAADGGYHLPAATPPAEVLSPLVLNCDYRVGAKVHSFSVTIFDMAGEGMRNPAYMAKQAAYLNNVSGVIYLKNPDYYAGLEKNSEKLTEHQYLEALFTNINNRPKDAMRARVAFAMTKFDKIMEMHKSNEQVKKIREMCVGNPVTLHQGGFDAGKCVHLNKLMLDLYNWEMCKDPHITTMYHKHETGEILPDHEEAKKPGFFARLFGAKPKKKKEEDVIAGEFKKWVMLFAVSALGANPNFKMVERYNKEGYLELAPSDTEMLTMPAGLMNVDPLLWILNGCDVYPLKSGIR